MVLTKEVGVPIPPSHTRTGLTAALATLEVGESLFVPGGSYGRVYNTAYQLAHRWPGGGLRFTTRQVEGGVRVWRVAVDGA